MSAHDTNTALVYIDTDPNEAPSVPKFKRPLDIVGAAVALALFSPIMLVVSFAIALTSRGPIFFRQVRVGLNGDTFEMLKFRSMFIDAEARRAEIEAQSERDGVCFKMRNDPRITPVGRFIRRTSIDELPQLINVLRGEMSMVGPRPALPEETVAYPARAHSRLRAMPGITGLWQVSGRADVGFDQMIELDLSYIRDCSLCNDIKLLFATVLVVVTGKGAY